MATLATLLVNLGVRVDGSVTAEQKIKSLKQRTGEFGKASAQAESGFAKFTQSIASAGPVIAGAAAAIGAAAVGIFEFVKAQTAGIDAMDDMAKSVGVGAEEFQRLQYVGSQTGVSSDVLATGIKKLNSNLLDMQNGGGKGAREALEAIGLTLEDLEGKSKTQQIGIIGDALQSVGDEAERSALSAKIFGKAAGPQMAQMLAEGASGMAELAAQTQGVLTEDDIERAKEFQDSIERVEAQISSFAREIAMELLPMVQDVVSAVIDWFKANDELIRQDIGAVIGTLAGVVRDAAAEFQMWAGIIGSLTSAFDGLGTAGEIASGIFKVLSFNIRLVVSPIATIKSTIADLIDIIEELGIVSKETADSSRLAIQGVTDELVDKKTENKGGGTGKRKATGPKISFTTDQGDGDIINFLPSEDTTVRGSKSEAIEQFNEDARKAAARGDKAAAKKAKDAAKKLAEQEKLSGITVDEANKALLSGDASIIRERLRDLSASTPRTNEIRPTVAIDYTNIEKLELNQTISSTDPAGAANEVQRGFKKALKRTMLSIPNTVVR